MPPLLLLALLAPPAPWEGVYFDGPEALAWGVDVELTADRVAFDPSAPDVPLQATATTLQFEAPWGRVRATWALVDGDLWLGVLHRTGGTWQGELQTTRPAAAPSSVRWQPRRGVLTLDTPAGSVTLPGVREVRTQADRFALVHSDAAAYRAASVGPIGQTLDAHRCAGIGAVGTVCPFGVLPVGRLDTGDPWVRRTAWRRVGDVMLTPWSIRLGPAGFGPSGAPPVHGRYEGLVQSTALRLDDARTRLALPVESLTIGGQPAPEELSGRLDAFGYRAEPRPGSVTWSPDARGVSRATYGHDCVMGHADVPGILAWFPLADGRIFLWHQPATHGTHDAATYLLSRVPDPDQ